MIRAGAPEGWKVGDKSGPEVMEREMTLQLFGRQTENQSLLRLCLVMMRKMPNMTMRWPHLTPLSECKKWNYLLEKR